MRRIYSLTRLDARLSLKTAIFLTAFALLPINPLAAQPIASPSASPVASATPSATISSKVVPFGGAKGFNSKTGKSTAKSAANGKVIALSAARYRARLTDALAKISAMEKRNPRPLDKVLDALDANFAVRRADGQTQNVSGNAWARLKMETSTPATGDDVKQARRVAQIHIRALDEWTKTPVYTAAAAGKIVADLAASGQIEVEANWWQRTLASLWNAVVNAWKGFWNWVFSWMPKPRVSTISAAPSDKWLWALFYVVVAAVLGLVAWFVFRAFGGSWAWGRRIKKSAAVLEGEDALLLLLPPDELRQRAENYAAQGQFREALRHRYLSLLLQLDARGVWRYDARRTNWEHIAALRRSEAKPETNRPPIVPALSDLTRRFDRVRYGGAACDDGQWNAFRADATTLESQVSTASKAPAMELAR